MLFIIASTSLLIIAGAVKAMVVDSSNHLIKRIDALGPDMISADQILEAFKQQNHSSVVNPRESLVDDNGTIYQYSYDFDTTEWNSMHAKLYQQLMNEDYSDQTFDDFSTPTSDMSTNSANDNSVDERSLQQRDAQFEPAKTICHFKNSYARAYTYTLGTITGTLCAGVAYGAEYVGRTQIVERTGLQDIDGDTIKVVLKYAWFATKWASTNACANELSYQVSSLCTDTVNGNKGDAKSTRGSKVTYNKSNGNTALTAEIDPQPVFS